MLPYYIQRINTIDEFYFLFFFAFFLACQKILQQRLRSLGSFSNSARTPTPTTTTATSSLSTFHSNSSNDHRNSNYQDLAYSNGYSSKSTSYHHQRSMSALPLQDHLQQQHHHHHHHQQQQQQNASGGRAGHHGNDGIHQFAYHQENSTLTAGMLILIY
uniref:Myb-like protein AA n=1 Tax=Elaeophora elaphi TaxID=1147741 RepID=A0A0R3RV21_9BILA